jgi:hypothetical protein
MPKVNKRTTKPKKIESDESDEDDVPILELVRRGDYIDAKWRAPGRGKGPRDPQDRRLEDREARDPLFGLVGGLRAARLDVGAREGHPPRAAAPLPPKPRACLTKGHLRAFLGGLVFFFLFFWLSLKKCPFPPKGN